MHALLFVYFVTDKTLQVIHENISEILSVCVCDRWASGPAYTPVLGQAAEGRHGCCWLELLRSQFWNVLSGPPAVLVPGQVEL